MTADKVQNAQPYGGVAMEPAEIHDRHDTVVTVIIDETTSQFVLIRNWHTGFWRFPGDRIRNDDIDPENHQATLLNVARRTLKSKIGLTAIDVRCILMLNRTFGKFYGCVGCADLSTMDACVYAAGIFSPEEVPSLLMSRIQHTVFKETLTWIAAS